jgi:hypothetical protein
VYSNEAIADVLRVVVRQPRFWAHLAVGLATLAVALGRVAVVAPDPAHASHCVNAQKLQYLTVREGGGDAFWNYDFESETVDRCNVDWPISFIFHGNAEIDLVKRDMRVYAGYGCEERADCGDNMHARMSDSNSPDWDGDGGLKLGLCTGNTTHFRIYSAGEDYGWDRMFNLRWGFYVLGTTHIDNRDCLPGGWAGRSERAEGNVARHVRPIWNGRGGFSAPVREDRVWLSNRTLPCRRQGKHKLCNDGRATTALVIP